MRFFSPGDAAEQRIGARCSIVARVCASKKSNGSSTPLLLEFLTGVVAPPKVLRRSRRRLRSYCIAAFAGILRRSRRSQITAAVALYRNLLPLPTVDATGSHCCSHKSLLPKSTLCCDRIVSQRTLTSASRLIREGTALLISFDGSVPRGDLGRRPETHRVQPQDPAVQKLPVVLSRTPCRENPTPAAITAHPSSSMNGRLRTGKKLQITLNGGGRNSWRFGGLRVCDDGLTRVAAGNVGAYGARRRSAAVGNEEEEEERGILEKGFCFRPSPLASPTGFHGNQSATGFQFHSARLETQSARLDFTEIQSGRLGSVRATGFHENPVGDGS
nr:VQ motif-containing protein 11-like [Ipomoea batatas]